MLPVVVAVVTLVIIFTALIHFLECMELAADLLFDLESTSFISGDEPLAGERSRVWGERLVARGEGRFGRADHSWRGVCHSVPSGMKTNGCVIQLSNSAIDRSRSKARELVLRFGWNATAYQIPNPGIELWFSAAGDAVVGFVRSGGMVVVGGAPVCDCPSRRR